MIKKKLSNAVIQGSSSLYKGNVDITNEALNQTQDRIELDRRLNPFINKTRLTNCILEAPERIKVELTSTWGITLKSGSIVTMPDGSEVTVNSDVSFNITASGTAKAFFVYNPSQNAIRAVYTGYAFSGDTRPTSPVESYTWLNTTNNTIEHYASGTWSSGWSLPFCIGTYNDNNIVSIDSVFNTFGAMGGTFWVQKGVKFLMPNGRNSDGSLNNTEYTTDSIKFYNIKDIDVGGYANLKNEVARFLVTTNGITWWGEGSISNASVYSNTARISRYFDEQKNLWYSTNNSINYFAVPNICVLSSFSFNRVNDVFHIMDVAQIDPVHVITKTDRNWVARMASPSVKYKDYILGASGQQLVALASGHIYCSIAWTGGGASYINLYDSTTNLNARNGQYRATSTTILTDQVSIKVNKGDIVIIDYQSLEGGTKGNTVLRFIYDEGAI